MKVLHVVNYGWPHVDGYTARSRSIVQAQRRELGIETEVAVSPFPVFARAQDLTLLADGWGPGQHQVRAVPAPKRAGNRHSLAIPRRFERPTLGLAPGTEGEFRRGLSELAAELRPDVIHSHHPAFIGRSARAVAAELGVPFVYEVRCFNGDYDLDARNPYLRTRGHRQNGLEMALARRSDQVVTISSGLAARLRRGGVAPDRVNVIRNAVDTTLWTPVEHHPEPGVVRVGYATTFEAIEGLDGLLQAVAKAAPKLTADGLQLEVVLAGAGRDWDRIDGLVDELGLREVVSLPGFLTLEELRSLYSELDLFVISRGPAAVASDTTPLKPLEALAAGLPLLATDLPAMRELLDGRPGVRFVPANPEGLTEGILAFADQSWRSPVPADLGDRSWASEVRHYENVYAAASAMSSESTKSKPGKSGSGLHAPPSAVPEYPLTDVHVHLGSSDSGEIYYPNFEGAEYLRHMTAAGVTRAAAFPPFRTDGYAAANAALRDWAPSTGGRVVAFARLGGPVVPLAQWPPLPWQVRRWVRRAPRASDLPGESLDGFGGVKLLPHLDGLPPASQLDQIADRRLPIVIHGGRFVPAGWVAKRLLPRTAGPVIIAHLGAFAHEDRLLDEAIEVARRNKRIYLDTSGIWDSAFCARAAAAVPEKLLFGSDAPLTTPAIAWAHLASCIADAGVLRAIGEENFQRAAVLTSGGG